MFAQVFTTKKVGLQKERHYVNITLRDRKCLDSTKALIWHKMEQTLWWAVLFTESLPTGIRHGHVTKKFGGHGRCQFWKKLFEPAHVSPFVS